MLEMVEGIKAAMKQDIRAASWMSKETKRAAEVKLNIVVDRIGYPDTWRDYSTLRVSRDDALGNLQRAIAFEQQRRLAKIGRRVDRGEWGMTPPTVNAYYRPDRNTINFPAGILQPPFYKAGRDGAVNYGGVGAVVGHELTHGFDDQGRKFDGRGNLRNWWTEADAKAYDERSACIADQYSQYVVAGDTRLNGRLTLGENTADNGGVRLALLAYLAGPGATPRPPSTASGPSSDSSSGTRRFGARTRGPSQNGCERRPIRTRRRGTGSTASCRTCPSSRRHSRARRTRRWCARTPAGCGNAFERPCGARIPALTTPVYPGAHSWNASRSTASRSPYRSCQFFNSCADKNLPRGCL